MIITPNVIETTRTGKYAVDPYSRLLSSRIIMVFHEITDDLAASVISQILMLDAEDPNAEIQMYINSPGGSVTAGLAILDVMRHIKAPISTVAVGSCASMAAVLLAVGGTKGKRYALPHAEIMVHQPLGGTQGQATDLIICAEHIKSVRDMLNDLLAEATGKTMQEVAAATERDNFMTAQQALAFGLIDRILC